MEEIAAARTTMTANMEAVALIRNQTTVSASVGQKRRKKNIVPWWSGADQHLELMSIVETGKRGVTYEDGGGVDTSEDGEGPDADDVVVEQRSTGLISLDRLLKLKISGMIRSGSASDTDCDGEGRNVPIEGIGSSGLSDDSEDHGELVGDETLAPKVVLGVEHVAVFEGGEPDAVQVEAPDNHLGVTAGEGKRGWRKGRRKGRGAGR